MVESPAALNAAVQRLEIYLVVMGLPSANVSRGACPGAEGLAARYFASALSGQRVGSAVGGRITDFRSAAFWMVLDHFMRTRRPFGVADASPLVRCLVESKAATVGGATELCLRNPRNMISSPRTRGSESGCALMCVITVRSIAGVTGSLSTGMRRMFDATALRASRSR